MTFEKNYCCLAVKNCNSIFGGLLADLYYLIVILTHLLFMCFMIVGMYTDSERSSR